LIIGFLALLGVGYLYYQFLLKPKYTEIADLKTQLEKKKQDLDTAKEAAKKYVEFKKSADSVQRELEWLQNRIPKSIDQAKLLETVNLIQERSGVFLTSFGFGAAPKAAAGAAYVEVPVNLRFNCDYKGLQNFLYQIGISNLFMTVRDLNVTPAAMDPTH